MLLYYSYMVFCIHQFPEGCVHRLVAARCTSDGGYFRVWPSTPSTSLGPGDRRGHACTTCSPYLSLFGASVWWWTHRTVMPPLFSLTVRMQLLKTPRSSSDSSHPCRSLIGAPTRRPTIHAVKRERKSTVVLLLVRRFIKNTDGCVLINHPKLTDV